MPKKIEDPLEYPVQHGRRIKASTGSVRDKDRVDGRDLTLPNAADNHEPLVCGRCKRNVSRRSIKPGSVLCARCRRDAIPEVYIYREPEDRRADNARRAAEDNAARAAAAAKPPRPPLTREHAVEIAWKNGALTREAHKIEDQAEREGQRLTPDEAMARAKDVVAEFGDTSQAPHEKPSVTLPHYPHPCVPSAPGWKDTRIIAGPFPSGRHVRGGSDSHWVGLLPTDARGRPGRPRKIVDDTAARVEALRLARKVRNERAALDADGVGSERQREAYVLVRVQGLRLAEAGRRMSPPISGPAVKKLLTKFDKATKPTT